MNRIEAWQLLLLAGLGPGVERLCVLQSAGLSKLRPPHMVGQRPNDIRDGMTSHAAAKVRESQQDAAASKKPFDSVCDMPAGRPTNEVWQYICSTVLSLVMSVARLAWWPTRTTAS